MFIKQDHETIELQNVNEKTLKKEIKSYQERKGFINFIYISAQIFAKIGRNEIEGVRLFPFTGMPITEIKIV